MTYSQCRERIREISAQIDTLFAERRKRQTKHYPATHVFDENKSVLWNLEEVERQNREIDEQNRSFNSKVSTLEQGVNSAILEYIQDEFGLNVDVAQIVFDKAYDDGHASGFEEVLCQANEYGYFVQRILSAVE